MPVCSTYLPRRLLWALVRSQNIFDRHFSEEGLAFISDEQAARLSSVVVQSHDILLNITGDGITFARACEAPASILPAVVNQHVSIIRVDRNVVDPGFLLAYLTHPIVKHYIESFNAGGSRRAITKGHIESFRVAMPSLSEQRAIAHILGTLDDKIELNWRMNETLETMARALFKSWFVDFDPVRAKMPWNVGRQPGASETTPGWSLAPPGKIAGLFPNRFEDSELGEIPAGWEVQSFADTVEIIGGGTPKTSVPEYWNGDIPWFSVVDAPSDSDMWVVDTEKKITHTGVAHSSTRLLPVGTTIISARGTVGRIALVGVPMTMNQSCYGLRGLVGKNGYFTYFATRTLIASLRQHAHGSVFDTITRDTLAGVSVALPPTALIKAFETQVAPMLERIRAALLGSRTLAALRDTLLPKLISGVLRVKDAERFIGRAL